MGGFLLAVGLVICLFTAAVDTGNLDPNTLQAQEKINLNGQNFLEINAASKVKKTKTKVTKKSTKKVKKASKKYKKVKAYYKSKTKKSYSYSSSGSWADDPTLDAIVRSGSRYRYSGSYHTGAALVARGAGDCWAMSDYLNSKFQSAGYQSRIVTYRTAYSSRHKAVDVLKNGQWQRVPYRSYGYNYLFV